MIILHEAFLIVSVEVIHLLPERALAVHLGVGVAVGLEGDERRGLMINNVPQILFRQIRFIRAHLSKREVLRGRVNQRQ